VVEESLANAFVMSQAFGESPLNALRTFIGSQSAPYRAGLRWEGNASQLLGAASWWSRFKAGFIGVGGCKWVAASSVERQGLEELARRLRKPGEVVAASEFSSGSSGPGSAK
jgi:hypothetical protein